MTFEEFFIKKRIDLAQLQRARPALYEEFRDHYTQMSEKSFDHTKKYWFNRLRKEFLLEVVEAPGPKSTGSTSMTPSGGKRSLKPEAVEPAADVSRPTKPAGFKPRFKPGATTSAQKAAEPPVSDDKTEQEPAKRPAEPASEGGKPLGFKPRFKPRKPAEGKE